MFVLVQDGLLCRYNAAGGHDCYGAGGVFVLCVEIPEADQSSMEVEVEVVGKARSAVNDWAKDIKLRSTIESIDDSLWVDLICMYIYIYICINMGEERN